MKKTIILAALLTISSHANAASFYPTVLSENTTGYADSNFLGAPDDVFVGIGGKSVTYDFGLNFVLNGSGLDFNVYEVDWGTSEFSLIDVLVSNDGSIFTSVKSSESALVRISGDTTHGNNSFGRSYDLGSFSSVRYIKIDGTGTGNAGSTSGFDLDGVGAHNVAEIQAPSAVPVPAALPLMLSGLGVLGFAARRKKDTV